MMPACKCSTYARNVLRTATGTAHWNDATGTGYAGDDYSTDPSTVLMGLLLMGLLVVLLVVMMVLAPSNLCFFK